MTDTEVREFDVFFRALMSYLHVPSNMRTISKENELLYSQSSNCSLLVIGHYLLFVVEGWNHSPLRESYKTHGHLPQHNTDAHNFSTSSWNFLYQHPQSHS